MRYLIFTFLVAPVFLLFGAEPDQEVQVPPTVVPATVVPATAPAVVAPAAVPPPVLQSQVKGLLVITLPDGSHAGTATQMNATAVKMGAATGFKLRFNQDVGPMMEGATDEVSKLMQVKHAGSLPSGYAIEFGFADKHSLKDGPSAAVACGLMAHAIITGEPLDQKFAATGDMTATGQVRPVGGVGAKIKGALRKDCTVFSVPKANADAVCDLYITDGLEAVSKIQIIAVDTFDEALAIGTAERSPEISAALADFKMVQQAISKKPANAGHPKVQEKLRAILKAIPGHQSAKLVALHGQDRPPKTLSLVGSLNAVENGAGKLAKLLGSGNYASDRGLDDPLRDTVFILNKLQRNIDPRTKPLLRSYTKVAYFFKERREKKYLSNGERGLLKNLIADLELQRSKLRNNKEIQQELLDE